MGKPTRGIRRPPRPVSESRHQRSVAVGTIVTDRPPHRSVRAHFSAYGSYLGYLASKHAGLRMQNPRQGQITIEDRAESLPPETMPLTATPERLQPRTRDFPPERLERR